MLVNPTAEIAEGVVIEPGAIIGREARIGAGTTVAAGAIVGYRVFVGRDCYVGPGTSVTHALIGDRVTLHAGARVGQDGFGYAMSAQGHFKVPQIGRVIVGDDVEIGANSTVDRGFLMDTTIGEGTKIDNLVQIAHNVTIGRHCIIVSQSGIAGSAQLGDFVIMGAHSGVVEQVKVGDGAFIAGMAHVKDDPRCDARMKEFKATIRCIPLVDGRHACPPVQGVGARARGDQALGQEGSHLPGAGRLDARQRLRAARLRPRGEHRPVGIGDGDIEAVVGVAPPECEAEIRIGGDREGALHLKHELSAALHRHLLDEARRDEVGRIDVELHPVAVRVLDHDLTRPDRA